MITAVEQCTYLRAEDKRLSAAGAGAITHKFPGQGHGFCSLWMSREDKLNSSGLDFANDRNCPDKLAQTIETLHGHNGERG